jgi:Fe-S oxidoreductase
MSSYTKQIHRCFRCGYCKFPSDYAEYNCPSFSRFRFETYSTGGRLWLLWAWVKKEVEWSENLAKIMFSCVTCKNCVEHCPMKFKDDIVDWIVSARKDIIEKGAVLSSVRDFLNNIHKYGNPWGEARGKRAVWAEDVKRYKPGDEFLFYVGCVGSYDERGQRMARSFAELLEKADVSYGILGSEEECDGNEVYVLGEMGLFQELARKNTGKFKELNVKKVVTLSPHAYNVMKNKYPRYGTFEVFHYTEVLLKIIQEAKLKLSELNVEVTYHDPCFLGRYNNIYEVPRKILKNIPGIKLVEMDRNRENSFCCGGGSGNFVMDLLGGSEESPSRIRVKEAYETGAEILAVACPSCLTMFEDAVKNEGLEKELFVKDISELLKEVSK